MNRTLLALLASTALAACSDQQLATAPSARRDLDATVAMNQKSAALSDAVADVFDRILPALGDSPSAGDVRAALRKLEASLMDGDGPGAQAAQPALENALDRLERADPALSAEVDAIRLALGAQ